MIKHCPLHYWWANSENNMLYFLTSSTTRDKPQTSFTVLNYMQWNNVRDLTVRELGPIKVTCRVVPQAKRLWVIPGQQGKSAVWGDFLNKLGLSSESSDKQVSNVHHKIWTDIRDNCVKNSLLIIFLVTITYFVLSLHGGHFPFRPLHLGWPGSQQKSLEK